MYIINNKIGFILNISVCLKVTYFANNHQIWMCLSVINNIIKFKKIK